MGETKTPSKYTIETGVPIPPLTARKRRGGLWGDLLDRLQVGQSAMVPLDGMSPFRRASVILGTIRTFKLRYGHTKKFTTRQSADGVRVWRVE